MGLYNILRRAKLGKTSTNGIADAMKESCTVIRNWKEDVPNDAEVVFRWGCTSNVPPGVSVVNNAKGIHLVTDKRGFRRILNEHELCPETWFDFWDLELRFEHLPCDQTVVLRTASHAQGRGLWVYDLSCDIQCEKLGDKCEELGVDNYYINEFIPKVAEYRVFCAQGRAVWVAQKTPGNPDDVAWNVAKGGRFDNVRWGGWPLKVVKAALEAHALTGLHFSGVDVMVDAEGKPYVLEANSAPSQTSPYRQSCVAKVFDWIIRYGKQDIPMIEERGGYRKFIHPAVCERAIVPERAEED